MRKTNQSTVTPEEFVQTFMTAIEKGKDPGWIADQLDMDRKTVNSRSARYRKQGINLPYFDRKGGRTVHPSFLNRVIARFHKNN